MRITDRIMAPATLASSATLIAITALYRELAAALTVFVTGPIWLAAWGIIIVSVVHWAWALGTGPRLKGALGLACCAVAVAVAITQPFEAAAIERDFQRDTMDAVVNGLRDQTDLTAGLVKLSPGDAHLSYGYGEVLVTEIDGHMYVLFYFWRSIDAFSGYVHVPPGGHITQYMSQETAEVDRDFGGGWYFVRGQ